MAGLRPVSFKRFEKFLLHVGCKHKRTKGDHAIYDRSDLKRPIVVPMDTEVTPFIIRTNLRTLGLTVKQYLEIIEKL